MLSDDSLNLTIIRQQRAYSTSKYIFLSHTSFRVSINFSFSSKCSISSMCFIWLYTIKIIAFLDYPRFLDSDLLLHKYTLIVQIRTGNLVLNKDILRFRLKVESILGCRYLNERFSPSKVSIPIRIFSCLMSQFPLLIINLIK